MIDGATRQWPPILKPRMRFVRSQCRAVSGWTASWAASLWMVTKGLSDLFDSLFIRVNYSRTRSAALWPAVRCGTGQNRIEQQCKRTPYRGPEIRITLWKQGAGEVEENVNNLYLLPGITAETSDACNRTVTLDGCRASSKPKQHSDETP